MRLVLNAIFAFACVATTNVYAVTESELQDIADCAAATQMLKILFETEGDYKNAKNMEFMYSRLFDVFYDKLSEYMQGKSNIDPGYLGKMPNRSLARYENMGVRQQLRYSSGVLNVNNCYQYLRKR
jgi:hypothetical protein